MHRRIGITGLALMALGATACGDADRALAVDCSTILLYSITVHVEDATTGAPVPDALVWVRDGAFQDTLSGTQDGTYYGFDDGERAGTYAVHVEHPDYIDWLREGVQVTEGLCHVEPVDLTASLEPAGS